MVRLRSWSYLAPALVLGLVAIVLLAVILSLPWGGR